LLLLLKKWCKPALDILREETDRNVSDSEINQVITQYYDHTQYKLHCQKLIKKVKKGKRF